MQHIFQYFPVNRQYFTTYLLSHCLSVKIFSDKSPVFLTLQKEITTLLVVTSMGGILVCLLHSPLGQQVAVCRTLAVTSIYRKLLPIKEEEGKEEGGGMWEMEYLPKRLKVCASISPNGRRITCTLINAFYKICHSGFNVSHRGKSNVSQHDKDAEKCSTNDCILTFFHRLIWYCCVGVVPTTW